VIIAANTHDMKAATETLDLYCDKKTSSKEKETTTATTELCLDKGYNYPEIEHEVVKRGYVPHIRQRGEGTKSVKKGRHYSTRRWLIERRTNS